MKNYDDLIHIADNALFKAKEKERDQSLVYSFFINNTTRNIC